MERNINSLKGYSIKATNGIIGEVEEFYFDDETWTIRYLVVKTGNWLSGREVLISPVALKDKNWANNSIPVHLTKTQIKNSPDIDTKKPVSRQQEIELYGHYQWQNYWGSGFYGGGSMGVSMPFPSIDRKVMIEPDKDHKNPDDDVHLRSTETITGYHIHASDGEIGHVKDFIIDDQTLQLLFFVVDTHNWIGGKKVLVPISAIKKVDWSTFEVFLNITTAKVKNSRLFEESEFVTA
jgi:sporulation protein YlmC with PRC-barrel domain